MAKKILPIPKKWCMIVLKVVESGGKCHEVVKISRIIYARNQTPGTEVGEAICLWVHTSMVWMPKAV